MKKTLFDKVWDSHVVQQVEDGPDILFIDRHMVHEVTSPVAFLGLKNRNIPVLYPERTFATADHNTPTINQHLPVEDPLSANQLKALEENATAHGISYWGLGHEKNGIVHVVGPEYGITQPGATIVCGDSHTSTHGAFGAIAFGIGTSEVEMVLSTQCIMQPKPKSMRININGELGKGVTPKDVALYIISRLTTSGATGYFVEYAGDVFTSMSMEGRMTVCNLSIEMGARGGMIAPDQKTFDYIQGREFTPTGAAWDKAMAYWETLSTDEGAQFDKEFMDVAMRINPQDKMINKERMEKWVVRKAFEDYLPESVAWRQKEQFSDGVGYSWIDTLKEVVEEAVSDEQMANAHYRFPAQTPQNKEEFYYRSIFEEHFPSEAAALSVPSVPSVACSTPIALEWDEAFKNMNDPSGRAVAKVHDDAYDD